MEEDGRVLERGGVRQEGILRRWVRAATSRGARMGSRWASLPSIGDPCPDAAHKLASTAATAPVRLLVVRSALPLPPKAAVRVVQVFVVRCAPLPPNVSAARCRGARRAAHASRRAVQRQPGLPLLLHFRGLRLLHHLRVHVLRRRRALHRTSSRVRVYQNDATRTPQSGPARIYPPPSAPPTPPPPTPPPTPTAPPHQRPHTPPHAEPNASRQSCNYLDKKHVPRPNNLQNEFIGGIGGNFLLP